MKFHCDRCKTRYSIADEKVRGKILKIRCKSCSSVITVKEGSGDSQAARLPGGEPRRARAASRAGVRGRAQSSSGSALQGAFEQALRAPSSAEPIAPPVLEAEWYVSHDGEQVGPFSLSRAQDWVESRQPDEELYCWSEGFDDWLPVEKVSHFRGLRGQALTARQGSGLLSMGEGARMMTGGHEMDPGAGLPANEETPVPLFAATLAQVVAETQGDREQSQVSRVGRRNGSSVSALGLPASRPPMPSSMPSSGPAPSSGSLFGSAMANAGPPGSGETRDGAAPDLEIGEASQVVKLPMLARQMGGAPLSSPGLPGMAGPSSAANPLGRGTGSHDQHSGVHSGLRVVQGAASVEMPRPELLVPHRRRASGMMMPIAIGSAVVIGVVSVLLYVALAGDDEDDLVRRGRVGDKSGLAYQIDEGKAGEGAKAADKAPATSGKSGARRVSRKTGSRSNGQTASNQLPIGPDNDEVDLSGDARELDPDDLFDVYNANKIGVTMCYNSALKRDPLLQVRRADVLITVGTSGAVSSVSIPSLDGTPLGTCLERRIRAWRFPRATRIFTSQFPIIFQS